MRDINKLVKNIVTESFTQQEVLKRGNQEAIKELKNQFIIDCVKLLGLKKVPKIIFTKNKSKLQTLAHFDLDNFEVVVYSKGRLMADVFRSLAHELKHVKQLETGELNFDNWEEAGKTGSPIENDANSFSGISLRVFGKEFPEINEIQFGDEDLNENFSNYDILSKIYKKREGNIDKYNDLVKRRYPSPSTDSRVQDNREKDFDATVANKGNIDKFNYLERNDQNRFLREESKKNNKHEFNCLMLKVPFKNWESFLSKIDKEDLYEEDGNNYGLETESHVTVLYGLHEEVDENQLINFVKEHCSKPIEISISKMGVFKNSKFEVLKLDVDSQELRDLNKIICENFSYTSKFPDYNPHITISYLKKGTSQKYLKELKTPVTKSLDTFLYSKVDGSKKEFKI